MLLSSPKTHFICLFNVLNVFDNRLNKLLFLLFPTRMFVLYPVSTQYQTAFIHYSCSLPTTN